MALKVLPAERVAHPERKWRFVQEARSASALNHPHIVAIYDIDQAEGIDFIAMEYVSGKTLAEALRRKGRLVALIRKEMGRATSWVAQTMKKGSDRES